MKAYSPVSVIVLNFNGRPYLKQCLDALLATDYPRFEVVVVDNASTDGSAEFIRLNYPTVRVIRHAQNYGYAVGYNLVMDRVENEHVAFLNNDVFVKPNWLKELMLHIDKEDVAAVVPVMKFFCDETRINSAGGNCDVYGVGWNRGNGEIDRGQYDTIQEVFYGNGGALLIKKRVWREVGSFDERYFLYGEDLDWCWRARLKGYKILYVPYSEVHHLWRGSGAPMMHLLERHWLSTILKNYSFKTLVFLIPKFAGLKFLKAVWLIRNGKLNEKLAVVKAVFWNIISLRATWQKRIRIQTFRKLPDAAIQKHMFKQSFELLLWLGVLKHPVLKRN